jgi:hypothetical protein
MNSSKLLVVIAGLQVLTVAGQWLGQPSALSTASAQVPDAGGQRLEMIEQLKGTNARLDKMIALMEGGNLKVKAEMATEKNAK